MHVSFEITDEILIASLDGELDHHTAAQIREEIDKKIDNFHCKHLIFNFKKVSFMDSSGIGVVMGRYNKMKELGGRVMVSGCSSYIDRILNMSGIYTIAPKYNNVNEALKVVKNKVNEKVNTEGVQ
ncbi:anti-sigma F factor antagonist [Anaerovorax odorimutans]|uniref:anti-sigma F factor antagonist n=1 Tax=Anaerovorax odorimutans TaxID=109327 RepID=UPI000416DD31|nr:anti-sigma F factor antagonist [Anaerovorax odorimutans]